MIFYAVVTEFYDNGKVNAWITNHASSGNVLPENYMKSYKNKDVYRDFFTDKAEAIKFCDEAKRA